MQTTTWDNPMGTAGFELIEFAAPDPKAMGEVFQKMGFRPIAKHRHKQVTLYRQGQIRRVVAAEHTGLLTQAQRLSVETGFKN